MADPVSWKVVERGWDVVAADGEQVGRVDDIAGDTEIDIFNGVVVSRGTLKGRRYVPSEQVGEIVEGTVHLTIDSAAFDSLGDYEEPPPSERFEAP
jgi:hypothetical protein